MAAVLCLVLLPLMAALGFMFGVIVGEPSATSVLGGLVFLMLGGGMFAGIFNMSRSWERNSGH
ncbi:MAG TPA: hypothetical protein VFS15_12910 [Kofleriaceae bacterium]|nr:hypothetical protein [Kofleriaceae bacterium]